MLEEFSVKVSELTPEQMNEWLENPKFANYVKNELTKLMNIRGFWGLAIDAHEDGDIYYRDSALFFSHTDAPSDFQFISSKKNKVTKQDLGIVYTDRFSLRKVTFSKVLHWREKYDGSAEVEYGVEKVVLLHGSGSKVLEISKTFWGRAE